VRHEVGCHFADEHGNAKGERDAHGDVGLPSLFFASQVRSIVHLLPRLVELLPKGVPRLEQFQDDRTLVEFMRDCRFLMVASTLHIAFKGYQSWNCSSLAPELIWLYGC
jgi:hypothetical protein